MGIVAGPPPGSAVSPAQGRTSASAAPQAKGGERRFIRRALGSRKRRSRILRDNNGAPTPQSMPKSGSFQKRDCSCSGPYAPCTCNRTGLRSKVTKPWANPGGTQNCHRFSAVNSTIWCWPNVGLRLKSTATSRADPWATRTNLPAPCPALGNGGRAGRLPDTDSLSWTNVTAWPSAASKCSTATSPRSDRGRRRTGEGAPSRGH